MAALDAEIELAYAFNDFEGVARLEEEKDLLQNNLENIAYNYLLDETYI